MNKPEKRVLEYYDFYDMTAYVIEKYKLKRKEYGKFIAHIDGSHSDDIVNHITNFKSIAEYEKGAIKEIAQLFVDEFGEEDLHLSF